jgi:hypothetical protein
MKQPHMKGDKVMEKTMFKDYVITVSDEDGDVSKATWKDARKHWRVTVKKDGKQVSYNFYGGSMANCKPLEAFESYISDAFAYRDAHDFFDFCDEFGYEPNRESKRIHHLCELSYYKLRKFIGSDDDISNLGNDIREELGW